MCLRRPLRGSTSASHSGDPPPHAAHKQKHLPPLPHRGDAALLDLPQILLLTSLLAAGAAHQLPFAAACRQTPRHPTPARGGASARAVFRGPTVAAGRPGSNAVR
jgi:hypothetical protein